MQVFQPLLYRLVVSAGVLTYLWWVDASLLAVVVAILVLDELDCNLYLVEPVNCKTFEYQKNDKLADLLTYVLVLALFWTRFDAPTQVLLCALLAFRAFGAFKFWASNDNAYLHTYVDGVSMTILVAYLATRFAWVRRHYAASLLAGLAAKAVYERIHHSRRYATGPALTLSRPV